MCSSKNEFLFLVFQRVDLPRFDAGSQQIFEFRFGDGFWVLDRHAPSWFLEREVVLIFYVNLTIRLRNFQMCNYVDGTLNTAST